MDANAEPTQGPEDGYTADWSIHDSGDGEPEAELDLRDAPSETPTAVKPDSSHQFAMPWSVGDD